MKRFVLVLVLVLLLLESKPPGRGRERERERRRGRKGVHGKWHRSARISQSVSWTCFLNLRRTPTSRRSIGLNPSWRAGELPLRRKSNSRGARKSGSATSE